MLSRLDVDGFMDQVMHTLHYILQVTTYMDTTYCKSVWLKYIW